ncbi:hypothetical protein [Rossellomorea aquimaris]|uniref:hypothetical protein n=1 Tax=Rossellomorea aquimaris TaxID=189382 RepID=UPI0007D0900C|nr:hypothetical protein [Rossellomorea aquimaris]
MNVYGYNLTNETLLKWDDKIIPNEEWFYLYQPIETLSTNVFEELNPPLDIRTSYVTWGIKKKARYISKQTPEAFLSLSPQIQHKIVKQQWELDRGLVFKKEDLKGLLECTMGEFPSFQLDEGDEVVLLHRLLWDSFDIKKKQNFLKNYSKFWISEESQWNQISENEKNILQSQFHHLHSFFDTFSSNNGPNCFSAVSAAILHNVSYLQEWMQASDFLNILLKEGYYSQKNGRAFKEGDVLVWFNTHSIPIHAAYVLNENFVFNKNGQTIFNPWQLVKIEDVLDRWEHPESKLKHYRR